MKTLNQKQAVKASQRFSGEKPEVAKLNEAKSLLLIP